MLKFNNITKVFKPELMSQPFTALSDVSFEIPRGSMVGFLGANGAGKTTSLKIIMDFIRPSSGDVSFSQDLGTSKIEVFRKIGFLPERPYFYPNLTGSEFLHYLGSLSDMTRDEISRQIKHWAPRFKIDYALERKLRTYSKGMLQRIGFLATVLHGPELIILDEPLSGLDPIGRKELKDAIVEIHRAGKTVFFSSHIVSDIEEICDRVIFLKEGKLIYDGEVDVLLKSETEDRFLIKFKSPSVPTFDFQLGPIESLAGGLQFFTVPESYRDRALSQLVAAGAHVMGLEQQKPSLEEIFYKIKPS